MVEEHCLGLMYFGLLSHLSCEAQIHLPRNVLLRVHLVLPHQSATNKVPQTQVCKGNSSAEIPTFQEALVCVTLTKTHQNNWPLVWHTSTTLLNNLPFLFIYITLTSQHDIKHSPTFESPTVPSYKRWKLLGYSFICPENLDFTGKGLHKSCFILFYILDVLTPGSYRPVGAWGVRCSLFSQD